MKVFVAGVEWDDDSIDLMLIVGTTLDVVRKDVRDYIEGFYGAYEDDEDPVSEYVTGPGLEEPDWETWHSTMHEMDGTPWVTIEEKEVLDG